MEGQFADWAKKLSEETPDEVIGHAVVDQVYAHYQHEHPEFNHPRGGQAFYLSEPFFAEVDQEMQRLTDGAIQPDGGSGLVDAMMANMDRLREQVELLAPIEFADLRHSTATSVEADGAIVRDRPAGVPRLTEEELKRKSRMRDMLRTGGYRGKRR